MAKLSEIIKEMTLAAGLDEEFTVSFMDILSRDEDLCQEFVDYIRTREFTGKNNVNGYSLIDILVWQVDRFKAGMDQGKYGMKNNECLMILKAFETMHLMKENPEKYLRLLTEETGQDMEAKSY